MSGRPLVAVVLAAGKGTRMRSSLPKVLHPAAGRPLLAWVLDAAVAAGCDRILAVVGHEAARVRRSVKAPDVEWVVQTEQLGTGHAVACARQAVGEEACLVVLSGDVPLVRASTVRRLVTLARSGWGALAVADVTEPGSLGRVRMTGSDRLERVVEAADATPEELALKTVNAGIYALPAPDIFHYLQRVGTSNAQGEIYLPDALNLAVEEGRSVACLRLEDESEAWGVNTPAELERVAARLALRAAEESR